MSAHTSGSLPLHGAVPVEASKIWAMFAKGRGCAGFCLWPVWPLSRTSPFPLEDLPGCFKRLVCKHFRRQFPQGAPSAPKSGRKSALGWSPLRAKGPEPLDQVGAPNSQAKA